MFLSKLVTNKKDMFLPNPLPSKSRALIYLLQIPILAIILKLKFIDNKELDQLVYMVFLILFGLTIGWPSINPYLKKCNNSIKRTLSDGAILYFCEILFAAITIILMNYLMGIYDPQGVKNEAYSLQHFLTNKMLQIVLIAVSEELFKVLIFIAFLSFFKNKGFLAILISTIAASFIFGAMHGFNYKLTGILPIAMSSIPSFIYLIKYNSIYPLIVSHFIFDTVFFISHIQPYGKDVMQLMLILIGFSYITKYFFKELYFNYRSS